MLLIDTTYILYYIKYIKEINNLLRHVDLIFNGKQNYLISKKRVFFYLIGY